MTKHNRSSHPWTQTLDACLDALEQALLANDAAGVEGASAQVQAVLQQAPRSAEFTRAGGSLLRSEMEAAARRFAQLRQAVLQSTARSQRAAQTLLPQMAPETYGSAGPGAGRNYHLSA